MHDDMGQGRVKKSWNTGDVIYGWPLTQITYYMDSVIPAFKRALDSK
jgi:hypothetical protein